jgi:pyruvate dehydrogenase E1 component beta subunit
MATTENHAFVAAYGHQRVRVTPISETAEIGIAIGAAMAGLRPVVELYMAEFMLVAMDQVLNEAPRFRYMSGGQVKVPLVLKAGFGFAAGWAGQHTGSLTALFMGVPGLKVVVPSTAADAKGLMATAIRDDNPVVFLEGEMLYNTKGEVPDGEHLVPIGVADLKREGDHCSVITHGKMALVAMRVADDLAKEGINIDVVDLRTVRPIDVEAIARSVQKTNRAVVLEEGWEICGMGSQVVDFIQRECFDDLDAPVLRVHQEDVPMPYAKNLERAAKPDAAKAIAAIKKVMYLD